jgi:hypothetical protein
MVEFESQPRLWSTRPSCLMDVALRDFVRERADHRCEYCRLLIFE